MPKTKGLRNFKIFNKKALSSSARPKRFGSRGPIKRKCEAFSARSTRIRHRSELTERDWENAVQGLGKGAS